MYLPLVFVNCNSNWAYAERKIIDAEDIVTPMMHYDVMLHLVFVYIGVNCALLSVVLVFEAEQSWLQIFSIGCGRTKSIKSIHLLGNRLSSGSLRKESIVYTFCLLPTEPVTSSIRWNLRKRQWCPAPTQVSQVLWVWCRNYCRLIVQHRVPCVRSTTLYSCPKKVKVWCQAPTQASMSSESGAETIVDSLSSTDCNVYLVQHYLLMLRLTFSPPSIWSLPTVALHVQ